MNTNRIYTVRTPNTTVTTGIRKYYRVKIRKIFNDQNPTVYKFLARTKTRVINWQISGSKLSNIVIILHDKKRS